MIINVKRVYAEPARSDGMRILIDRLWPRGCTKEAAALDLWAKDIAPSTDLRKWFHADTAQWPEFTKRYKAELKANQPALDDLIAQIKATRKKTVTLLFASKDESLNHAHILRDRITKSL